MNNDNTYKLAWGRAILECVSFDKYKISNSDVIIEFDDISECMIKYYPSEEIIKRLKERNEKLLNILEGKYKDDLKLSIENNYLEKFFYECRL